MKLLASLALYTLAAASPEALGLDNVTQAAGYFDVPHGSLFYWLFEARNSPETAPTVFWFNGGPGCSSLTGLVTENGPVNIQSDLSFKKNQYSWNENANVVYLDQPVGVGFSTASQQVSTTVDASLDVLSFYTQFFKKYPKYLKNDVHLAGESYAGRYIPVFAEAIMKTPGAKALKSIMLGDAVVDEVSYYASNYDYFCVVDGGFPDIIDQNTCEKINASIPGCISQVETIINSGAKGTMRDSSCRNADLGLYTVEQQGLNTYNLEAQCEPSDDDLCYTSDNYVSKYFNQDSVQRALGVDTSLTFQVCNNEVNSNFASVHDAFKATHRNVTNLLDLGVQVLVYNGDKDPLVTWVGSRNWTRSLDWSGQNDFVTAIDNPAAFTVDGKKAGEVSNSGNMTFLRVYHAGHMVPMDQPAAAATMLDSWISGKLNLQ